MDSSGIVTKREVLSVQYLRAVAAIMIVMFHVTRNSGFTENKWILQHVNILQSGVDIFFVISGFIMWYTTRGTEISPRRFIVNRLIRIVPIYWLVTLFVLTVALVRPDLLRSTVFDFRHAVASLLFIPWLHPLFPEQYWPVVIPGWSLNYEIFFYFIFAAGLFFRARFMVIYLMVVFALVLVCAAFITTATVHIFYGDAIILEFLFGVLIGAMATSGLRLPATVSVVLVFIAVLFLALSDLWGGPRFLLWGFPAFALVAGAVFYELSAGMPEYFALKRLGDASYSIYLLHGIVLAVVLKSFGWIRPSQMDWIGGIVFTLAVIAVSCVAGILSYMLVEKPSNLALKRLFAPGRRAVAPS